MKPENLAEFFFKINGSKIAKSDSELVNFLPKISDKVCYQLQFLKQEK